VPALDFNKDDRRHYKRDKRKEDTARLRKREQGLQP
jgi:hypothetical protein